MVASHQHAGTTVSQQRPTPTDASAVETPVAINRQNSRCTARDGSGRPDERIGARNARSAAHCRLAPVGASGNCLPPRPIEHLHHHEVVQRPLEPAQYTSVRYGERLAEIGAVPSVGSVGDSDDDVRRRA